MASRHHGSRSATCTDRGTVLTGDVLVRAYLGFGLKTPARAWVMIGWDGAAAWRGCARAGEAVHGGTADSGAVYGDASGVGCEPRVASNKGLVFAWGSGMLAEDVEL